MTLQASKKYFYHYGGAMNSSAPFAKVPSIRSEWIGETIDSTDDPQYKSKIAKRQNASHYYKRDFLDISQNPICLHNYTINPKTGPVRRYGMYSFNLFDFVGYSSSPIAPTWDYRSKLASSLNVCIAKSKSKLERYSNEINFLVDIGEYKETIAMIKRVRSFIFDWIAAIWDLRKLEPRKFILMVSESWLAFNFGLRPLIDDLSVAIENLTRAVAYPDTRVINSVSPEYQENGTFPRNATWFIQSGDGVSFVLNGGYNITAKVTHKARVIFPTDVKKWTYIQTLGLDLHSMLNNSASTVWELIPFTWVIDYFFSIGEAIEDDNYSAPGVCVSSDIIYDVNVDFWWDVTHTPRPADTRGFEHNFGPKTWGKPRASGVRIIKERQPTVLLPARTVQFKLGAQINSNADSKLMNLVAVLVQSMGKNGRGVTYNT